MKQLVCLSATPWRSRPTRAQQLLRRLKDVDVLYFEPSPSTLSRRAQDKKAYQKPGRRCGDRITIYSLPPILPVMDNHPHIERHYQQKNAAYIQKKLRQHHMDAPLLWVESPTYAHLLELIPHCGVVYDCNQDWSQLPVTWESELACRADVVFAASHSLAEHLEPCSQNITLLPYGADYDLFQRMGDVGQGFPSELVSIPSPVLGFAGTIWEDLDLSPLLYTAKLHKTWSFVLVGRVSRKNPWAEELCSLKNVHFLGAKSPRDAAVLVNHFDVCLSFNRQLHLCRDILSPRIYEYLCTGKPIVSDFLPEQGEQYPDVIYWARGEADFSHQCTAALRESGSWYAMRRQIYGREADWQNRANAAQQILESACFL